MPPTNIQQSRGKHVAFLLPDMRGGGAERVALTLATEFVRRGHKVTLLLGKADGELLPLLPDEVQVLDLRADRVRSMLRPVQGYLARERPDALLAFMWPLTIIAVLAAKLARSSARVVVSDHAVLSRQYAAWGRGHRLALSSSIRLLYPLAHARLQVSEGAAEDLAQLGGLERAAIQVIHNPVPGPGGPVRTDPRVEALWPGQGPRLLAVGSLKGEKDHPLLLRAFARLPEELGARLMILGEGSLRAELEALSSSLGVSERAAFPGFAADPWPFYASADLFVLSSSQEGFGNVIVEALHAGLKVVSTDCPHGPSEILAGGRYGALVPTGDEQALAEAITRALGEPADADRARGRAKVFAGEAAFAAYERVLFG